jgi:hypothetical protein
MDFTDAEQLLAAKKVHASPEVERGQSFFLLS